MAEKTKAVRIGKLIIGNWKRTSVIAEVSVNHNHDIQIAKKMIDSAASARADIIKFQTFRAESLIGDKSMLYSYSERGNKKTESQYGMFKRLELPFEWHKELKEHAEKKGLIFMSTPGDEGCADFLEEIKVEAYKIGSDDLTNLNLIKHVSKKGKPVIISTGMSTLDEIDDAVNAVYSTGNKSLVIMHCSSEYPASPESINLRFMQALMERFNVPVGFSDHTVGISVPLAASALGACMIEKHFTLDKNMKGPDHSFSADIEELKAIVDGCNEIHKALGSPLRVLSRKEQVMRIISRKTIVASRNIKKNEKISYENVALKRANGIGFHPKFLDKIIGKTAKRNISKDEPIASELLFD